MEKESGGSAMASAIANADPRDRIRGELRERRPDRPPPRLRGVRGPSSQHRNRALGFGATPLRGSSDTRLISTSPRAAIESRAGMARPSAR